MTSIATLRRAILILCCLTAVAGLALSLAVVCGSSGCGRPLVADQIYLSLRLPRALTAFIVGGLLALAGALMQVLLRNPLADPYVLGLSGGSAAGALSALLVASHFGFTGDSAAALGAALGAGLAVSLLFGLARQALRRLPSVAQHSGHRLILTGVMIAAGFGAIVTLVLTLAPDAQLRGMLFWLMGDLEDGRLLLPAAVLLALLLLWSVFNAQQLNLLARGEGFAQLLGVPVLRLRWMTLAAASLATAAAVTVAGTIGFIGLVVPHAIRLLVGNDQRILLPASVLAGGAALALADLAARTVVAPTQLPVGVITALVGVPVFLWLLARSRA
ncbi:Vitamin B12 ABC transporter [Collimonas arenae]|uniref:Vitamin B12 ABC transporter n=1 Tax=Collimonas arenae TaxID=279058 RepID=A0A0A1FEH2_9BURK|nr:Vitamin B12 ABC transporter [Collimonas arenae]